MKGSELTETAVYESTHGGVRGRGSNPSTYSIKIPLKVKSQPIDRDFFS